MSRKIHSSLLKIVPERYLYQPLSLDDFPTWGTYSKAREACPYKQGDVIWGPKGRRALVIAIFIKRLREDDPISDLLPVLRVRELNKNGEWSMTFIDMWPGQFERAFEKAKTGES